MNPLAQQNEIAMQNARLGDLGEASRKANARRYEQLIADLENADTPTFIQQLVDVLQGETFEADLKLHTSWLTGNDKQFMQQLREEMMKYIHLLAEANF